MWSFHSGILYDMHDETTKPKFTGVFSRTSLLQFCPKLETGVLGQAPVTFIELCHLKRCLIRVSQVYVYIHVGKAEHVQCTSW